MRLLLSLSTALLILIVPSLEPSYAQSSKLLPDAELPASQERQPRFHTVFAKDETRPGPSNDTIGDSDYRPAREIKRFTTPSIRLKGTAIEVGLDSRTLAGFLETHFLQDFSFLQSDFTFDKTYETWEIGLFDCEAWTVGSNYPIALHVQCAAGSMDEPRHWLYAMLGYGPKNKIVELVRTTLDSIVADYAAFVRKARGNNGF